MGWRGKRGTLLPFIVGGLALGGALLVVLGRLGEAAPQSGWQDPFYSVLLAFTLDATFLGQQSLVTLIGALAAALATYLAVIGGAFALFERHITAWRARRLRDHVVVVGDDAEAEDFVRALGRTVPALLVTSAPAGRAVRAIALPSTAPALARAAHLAAARAVCLVGDERRNAGLATALAQSRGAAARPAIFVRVGARAVADRLARAVPGAARIEVFDDADMLAREAFARHPAHAAAVRLAARRVHFVICGFGRLGQAMAEEAIFSGLAAGLDKPFITVLDVDAEARERLYRAARPGLDLAADFAFIPADLVTAAQVLQSAEPAFEALRARDAAARVTGLALCLGDDIDNVRLALALPELRRREGRYVAPTFLRARDRSALGIVVPAAEAGEEIVPLTLAGALLATAVLDTDRRDAAARLVHAAYRQAAGAGGAAAVDWERLDETYRRANRRAADHLAAKLFSLGLTSERAPQAPVTVAARAHAEVIAPLLAGPAAGLDALAALEHRRWVTDRAIDGWSYGPVRDDDRKHHPLLATPDYAALPAAEQAKDRAQIRTLLGALAVADGAGAMPETCVALAGHRALTPAEARRGAAALAARLAARLADPARAVTLMSPLAPGADMALCAALAAALRGRVGALRLVAVEAVPYRVVLEVAAAEEGDDETVRRDAVAALLDRRAALTARFDRVDVARVGVAGRTDDAYRRDRALFEAGLVAANAYLVRRADLLGVLWDGAPARGPGGTADLVRLWQAPDAIAPALDPGPWAGRGVAHDAASLVVETVRRAPG
jgi:hypothetical protein